MANYRSIVPIMTDYVHKGSGITVSASSEEKANGYVAPAWSVFDGKLDSGNTNMKRHYWETVNNTAEEFILIDFNINKYCIRKFSINTIDARKPKNIRIEASDDNLTWKKIYDIKNFTVVNQDYEFDNKIKYRYYKIIVYGGAHGVRIYELKLYEDLDFKHPKFLIKQSNDYYSVKNNLCELGQSIDNTQLEQWYDKYGMGYISILTTPQSFREMPMALDEITDIWKTDFELDANNIIDNVELIENEDIENNYKIIKYDSPQYRIFDELNDEFEIMMIK